MSTQTESQSGLPTAALILGIVSVVFPIFILSVLAITFGGVGMSQSAPYSLNHRKAGWGVFLGIVSLVVSIILVLVLVNHAHQPSDPGCGSFYSCN